MIYNMENEFFEMKVESKGCEIVSLKRKDIGAEYIWDGNPDAWKRHAPILFPVVGKYKGNITRYKGKEYRLSQHGFARDTEFELVERKKGYLCMKMTDNSQTRQVYPFAFELQVAYTLAGQKVQVSWKVKNTGADVMYFSIGGHPAFVAPQGSMTGANLKIYAGHRILNKLQYQLLSEDGLCEREVHVKDLDYTAGKLKVTEDMFDQDAWIVETEQYGDTIGRIKVEIDGRDYLGVSFKTPVVGLWSAKEKGNPFLCIEPWYGRTDAVDFDQDLTKREYGNSLNAGECFDGEFEIEVF